MFTIDDIKVLAKTEGATAILVTERAPIPEDIKKEFEKQVKKATKLPVIYVPNEIESVRMRQ